MEEKTWGGEDDELGYVLGMIWKRRESDAFGGYFLTRGEGEEPQLYSQPGPVRKQRENTVRTVRQIDEQTAEAAFKLLFEAR